MDMFFVLSGYIVNVIAKKNDGPAVFFWHRLARIVPLYWIFTISLFLFSIKYSSYLDSGESDYTGLIKSLLFIPYQKGESNITPILGVGWTLNFEMLFYVAVAISLKFTRQIGYKFVVVVLISLFYWLVSDGCGVYSDFYKYEYLMEFLVGLYVVPFLINISSEVVCSTKIKWAFIFLLCFIMVLFDLIDTELSRFIAYGVPAALLCAVFAHFGNEIKDGFISKIFISVGDSSYSLYITHVFVIEFYRKIVFKHIFLQEFVSLIPLVVTFISCIVVSITVHQFLDSPIQKRLRSIALGKLK